MLLGWTGLVLPTTAQNRASLVYGSAYLVASLRGQQGHFATLPMSHSGNLPLAISQSVAPRDRGLQAGALGSRAAALLLLPCSRKTAPPKPTEGTTSWPLRAAAVVSLSTLRPPLGDTAALAGAPLPAGKWKSREPGRTAAPEPLTHSLQIRDMVRNDMSGTKGTNWIVNVRQGNPRKA